MKRLSLSTYTLGLITALLIFRLVLISIPAPKIAQAQAPSVRESEVAAPVAAPMPKQGTPDDATVCVKVKAELTPEILCGSGVAIALDGKTTTLYVITNHHMIAGSPEPIAIVTKDNVQLTATVVKDAPMKDLALLKLEGEAVLPAAPIGNSEDIQEGDEITTIGYPGGIERTITSSKIGKVNVACDLRGKTVLKRCIGLIKGAVRPGNSGGSLNKNNKVIAINRASREGTGTGVSIPIEEAVKFALEPQ